VWKTFWCVSCEGVRLEDMKYIVAFLLALAMGLVFIISTGPVSAQTRFSSSLIQTHWNYQHYHHPVPQPPAPPVVPPPVSNPPVATGCTKAINYGYQSLVNGQYDMNQVNSDLAYLKAHGYNCLRLAFFFRQNSGLSKSLAKKAHVLGFYVLIGNDGDPRASGYNQGVIAEATWAQANGIEQVSIGNEASKDSDTQRALSELSCAVRQVYSGVISYDTYLADPGQFDDIKAWAANKGCLDKLGLNIYANYANTAQEANSLLGSNDWYVSETDLDCDAGLCNNDTSWANGLSSVFGILRPYGVPLFVFSFDAGGDAVNPHWGIQGHSAVMQAIGL
jgi:hypothetical protein